ncbi:hypothetical protein EDB85DRAFT_1889401 [Lactarius pseudohatsudake]|nr:hypothetical protein EDB85DRAFT_1889401 [Lactarius pseudohatsudake]
MTRVSQKLHTPRSSHDLLTDPSKVWKSNQLAWFLKPVYVQYYLTNGPNAATAVIAVSHSLKPLQPSHHWGRSWLWMQLGAALSHCRAIAVAAAVIVVPFAEVVAVARPKKVGALQTRRFELNGYLLCYASLSDAQGEGWRRNLIRGIAGGFEFDTLLGKGGGGVAGEEEEVRVESKGKRHQSTGQVPRSPTLERGGDFHCEHNELIHEVQVVEVSVELLVRAARRLQALDEERRERVRDEGRSCAQYNSQLSSDLPYCAAVAIRSMDQSDLHGYTVAEGGSVSLILGCGAGLE